MCPRDTLMVSWGLIGDDIAHCLIEFDSVTPKEMEKVLLFVSPAISLLHPGSFWVIKVTMGWILPL